MSKRSIVTIANNDDLCCARAIVTMKALADGGPRNPDYRIYVKVVPFKSDWPRSSTVKLVSLNARAVWRRWPNSKRLFPIIKSR